MSIEKRERITSICPATGWGAVYFIDEPPWFVLSPLAVWGTIEYETRVDETTWIPCEVNGPDSEVSGFDAEQYLERCEKIPNFNHYVLLEGITEADRKTWAEWGKDRYERKRARSLVASEDKTPPSSTLE